MSPATAHRWWHRWRDATEEARATLSCLFDRSSRPRRSPRQLAPELAELICACRRKTGWGPRLGRRRDRLLPLDGVEGAQARGDLAPGATGAGAGQQLRVALPRRPAAHGHKRVRPLPATRPPSPATVAARTASAATVPTSSHAIVDDHSRLAYAEVHDNQRAVTVIGFLERALAFYASHGIRARRLMTDNAWIYVKSRGVSELLARYQIRHLTTKPYRPRTNGKVERFHQTMAREWAYGLVYSSHRDRTAALPHWLDHYNTRRPHSSIAGHPPISRVHNVHGQDS
ncbi:MAG: transposase family protein [Actinobacteria bacterium]|nr:transposase family protein [Actinomycetota bacterium]